MGGVLLGCGFIGCVYGLVLVWWVITFDLGVGGIGLVVACVGSCGF